MALEFGLFPGQDRQLQTADYRTAGSHQAENVNNLITSTGSTYEVIHTVTVGKTYYVSAIAFSSGVTTTCKMAIGASASEVDIFAVRITEPSPLALAIPTPLKFSSATRITVWHDAANEAYFTLIGWEE